MPPHDDPLQRWADKDDDRYAARQWAASTGQEVRETPASIRDQSERWAAALTGAPPPPLPARETVIRPDGVPTDEYLDWLLDELERLGCTIRVKGGQPKLTGNTAAIPPAVIEACIHNRIHVLRRLGERYPDAVDDSGPPLPEPGRLVEWLGPDEYPESPPRNPRWTRLDGLLRVDWVMWRYVNHRVWHAYSGYTFEV